MTGLRPFLVPPGVPVIYPEGIIMNDAFTQQQVPMPADVAGSTLASELGRLDSLVAEASIFVERAGVLADRLGGPIPQPAATNSHEDPMSVPESHLLRLQQANDRLEGALHMVANQIHRAGETIG